MSDEIEQQIQEKGLTELRVTSEAIEEIIASEHYFTGADGVIGAYKCYNGESDATIERYKPDQEIPKSIESLGLLTFCVLVLKNGFTVVGNSACANPENFDAEIGKKIARRNAIDKTFPFVGYLIKQRIHESKT